MPDVFRMRVRSSEDRYLKVGLKIPNTPCSKASSTFLHILNLGLELLGLGRTLYLWKLIVECLSQAVNLIRESKFAYGVTNLSIYTQSLLGRVHFPKWLFGQRS